MAVINGKAIGPVGFGLMGFTWRKEIQDFPTSIKVMKCALDLGANNWNGGHIYGTPDKNSLHLLRDYFAKYPGDADGVVLSIKSGVNPKTHKPDGSAENVKWCIEDCNKVLDGCKKIDIFELARIDPGQDLEESIQTMAEGIKEGKIGGIGLSEVGAKTIRRAQEFSLKYSGKGIVGVEVELSLWATDIFRNGVASTCAELGIPIFAYSPLARGSLVDKPPTSLSELREDDPRRRFPKYQDDVLAANNRVTEATKKIAQEKGVTVPQAAIAWVKGQSGRTRNVVDADGKAQSVKLGQIIPLPGATTEARVNENFADVSLTEEELKKLDEALKSIEVVGDRYDKNMLYYVEA